MKQAITVATILFILAASVAGIEYAATHWTLTRILASVGSEFFTPGTDAYVALKIAEQAIAKAKGETK